MSKDSEKQRLFKAGAAFWTWMTAEDRAKRTKAKEVAIRSGYRDGRAVASHKAHGWVDYSGDEVYITRKGHEANARHVKRDFETLARKKP